MKFQIHEASVPLDACYDRTSPYLATHVGKLVLDEIPNEDAQPPQKHCIVKMAGNGDYALVRFTEFHTTNSVYARSVGILSLSDFAATPADAARIHAVHLDKLTEVGLSPWYVDVQAVENTHEPNRSGIYILQKLLPPGSVPLPLTSTRYNALKPGVSRYKEWVLETEQPIFLYDIEDPDQGSRLPDDTVVLHDVEPLYRSVGQSKNLSNW